MWRCRGSAKAKRKERAKMKHLGCDQYKDAKRSKSLCHKAQMASARRKLDQLVGLRSNMTPGRLGFIYVRKVILLKIINHQNGSRAVAMQRMP